MEILKLANPLSIAAYPRIKQPNPPLGIIYQHANPMIYFCTGRFWRLKIKCFGAVGHFLLYMDNTGRNRIYLNAPLGASLNIDKYACACKQHAQNRKNHIYIYIYYVHFEWSIQMFPSSWPALLFISHASGLPYNKYP